LHLQLRRRFDHPGDSVIIASVPQVVGIFTGGTSTPTSSLEGCHNQMYAVVGTPALATGGSGVFHLTHDGLLPASSV
jgi:hypothetical protein